MPFWNAARPWLLPVITTAGGLVAGIMVFSLAPEAEGHGTDAAIGAFHQGKPIRARIPLIKLVASAITIGSGGSAGREGPSAQISAGFGSLLADVLHLDTQDRRIALATGIGAGIGAIFRAPLGGAILAAEILYKEDLEVEAIIPALIASIVGYSVFGNWSGWNPIFTPPDNSVADMMRTYRLTLTRNLRRTRGFVKGTAQVEIEMTPEMPLVGRALDEGRLPAGCLVVSLRRAGAFLFPQGSTVVQAGDLVTFLVSPQGEEALQRYLAAGASSVSSPAVAHEDELLLSHAEE